MSLKIKLGLNIGLLFISAGIIAQEKEAEVEFKPQGKIVIQAFLDYSTGLGSVHELDGFDATRALIGYNYQFTPTIQAQITLDGAAGRDASGNLEPALRHAFIKWEDKGFSVSAGLIGLQQFSHQDKVWRHRYVLKSFQDLNKLGHGVDAGIVATYKASPTWSVDVGLTNGEGYRKVNKNNSTKYNAGVTFTPNKHFLFRIYGDYYNESEKMRLVEVEEYEDQYTLSFFGAYENELLSIGAEYGKLYNRAFAKNKDTNGFSIFSTVNIAKKWNVYGRYDTESTAIPAVLQNKWIDIDSQYSIFGVEYNPVKGIKISPNFRNYNPDGADSEQFLFVNAEFHL